jgi:CDGSH-type Zn-finger protein
MRERTRLKIVKASKETGNSLSNSEMRIKVSKNGPYLVSGRIPLIKMVISCDGQGTPREWSEGEKFRKQDKCGLCRCGQSRNKPFCDGSHLKVNFDGTETADRKLNMEKIKRIDGPSLEMSDVEILCASARFCHRGGEIWSLAPRSDDPQKRRTAIEDACDCPSGRLVVWDKKTGKAIEPAFEPSIGLVEDPSIGVSGPIWVRGRIPVESGDGKVYEVRNRVTLCRCGKSSNKPFCDSSHYPEEDQEPRGT